MPGMNAVGTNTAASMSAIATTGPPTCSMAFNEASLGLSPAAMFTSTASTTTIASSTTRPMARTSPKRERELMENPSIGKKMKVPRRDTGTVSAGINVVLKLCRKMKTTRITKSSASHSVVMISLMPARTESVVSRETT